MSIITKNQLEHYLTTGNHKDAVDILYKRYAAMLYGYILKFVRNEDDAQEILVNLFASLPELLLRELYKIRSVYCWLQQKARHFIFTFLEIKGEESVVTEGFEFLEHANENDQIVFMRIYLQGHTRKQVAEELRISEEQVSLSLYQSVKILKATYY